MDCKNATRALLEFKEISNRTHIKFWLSCGTLLAAVRDGNFISYDDDIDLIVLAGDWNFAFQSTLKREFEIAGFSPVWRVFLKKYDIRIDICPYCYYAPMDVFVYPRKFRGGPEVREIPRSSLERDVFVQFLGQKFRIPDKAEEILETMYGSTWRTPQRTGWKETRTFQPLHPDEFMKWLSEHPKEAMRKSKEAGGINQCLEE